MSGTLITQLTSSNSAIHTNYFDPLINQNTNFMALDVRKTGIYSGGYLTPTDNAHFSMSTLSCEIQDSGGSGNQIRLVTSVPITGISVSNATPPYLVVLRWTYTASSTGNYPYVYVVQAGQQNATDLVVGAASYSGPTLSADYGVNFPLYLRSDPTNITDLCLKVEANGTFPYAMTNGVIVRYGRANYGNSTFILPTQVVSGQLAPSIGTPNYYQNIPLQITTTGTFATLGTGTTTAGSTPTAPGYNNLITIAEITVQASGAGGAPYTITAIKDVRCFVNGQVTLTGLLPAQSAGTAGLSLVSNGTAASWGNATYA